MTSAEFTKVVQLVTSALERNVHNRLTEDLATGILTVVTHHMQAMIEQTPAAGEASE